MSKIEWTERTWNPIVGCSVVSPGCTNCYAMRMAGRLAAMGQERYADLTTPTKAGPVWTGRMRPVPSALTLPFKRRRPTTYFVNSMSDLFHAGVADTEIDRVFAVMALCPQHTFQVLTKRSARMRTYLAEPERKRIIARAVMDISMQRMREAGSHEGGIKLDHFSACFEGHGPFPNVWLGVSVEDQRRADERWADLAVLASMGWTTFVSYEPALGPVDWKGWGFLRWLISGGESGPGARPSHPDWHRVARDFCAAHGIAYLFKQHGAWVAALDREREDPDWRADYSNRLNDRHPGIAWLNLAGGSGFHGERFHVMRRVGKAAAGRTLDGVVHDGMPEVRR